MAEIIQNVLIILLPAYALIDNRGATIINHWPITVGLFAGIIMGDVPAAMTIAGTFQLMSLGVAALGGSSVPDYALATVVSIFLHARTNVELGTAVVIGLLVGILALNLDVLTHTLNSFVANKSKSFMLEGKFTSMKLVNWISILMVALQAIIPMVILVAFGPKLISGIVDSVPAWITTGLNVAGGMLPVIGVVMLMRYMPLKKFFWAVLIGFVFSGYVGLPILAISMIGLAMASIYYMNEKKLSSHLTSEAKFDEGGLFDE
ncbi:TPA: PTS sugar transporter subunit IIC [Streptococcus suis]|nr:PTS sugar transporter subunit IIC [Streptococcus suis]